MKSEVYLVVFETEEARKNGEERLYNLMHKILGTLRRMDGVCVRFACAPVIDLRSMYEFAGVCEDEPNRTVDIHLIRRYSLERGLLIDPDAVVVSQLCFEKEIERREKEFENT